MMEEDEHGEEAGNGEGKRSKPRKKQKKKKRKTKKQKKKKEENKEKKEKKRGTHPRGRPNGRAGHCTRLRECNSLQLHRERRPKTSDCSVAPVQCPT